MISVLGSLAFFWNFMTLLPFDNSSVTTFWLFSKLISLYVLVHPSQCYLQTHKEYLCSLLNQELKHLTWEFQKMWTKVGKVFGILIIDTTSISFSWPKISTIKSTDLSYNNRLYSLIKSSQLLLKIWVQFPVNSLNWVALRMLSFSLDLSFLFHKIDWRFNEIMYNTRLGFWYKNKGSINSHFKDNDNINNNVIIIMM